MRLGNPSDKENHLPFIVATSPTNPLSPYINSYGYSGETYTRPRGYLIRFSNIYKFKLRDLLT